MRQLWQNGLEWNPHLSWAVIHLEIDRWDPFHGSIFHQNSSMIEILFHCDFIPGYGIFSKFCTYYDNNIVFSCNQAALRTLLSIRLSLCLSVPFHNVPVILSSWNFQELLPQTKGMSMQKVKVRGQRSRSQRSKQIFPQFGLFRTITPVQFESTDGYEMMHMHMQVA